MRNAIWMTLALGLMIPMSACERDTNRDMPGQISDDTRERADEARERAEEARERQEEVNQEVREQAEEMQEPDRAEEMREGQGEIDSARRGESDLEQSVRGFQQQDGTPRQGPTNER